MLARQALPAWQHYAYLGLYDLAYMLDDALVLAAAVVTLEHLKLGESGGRWLKLLSGVVMLGLGALLLVGRASINPRRRATRRRDASAARRSGG